MKKILCVLILSALTAAGAFAQASLSAGGGVSLFDGSWGNGLKFSESGVTLDESVSNMSFGGFAFLDAAYAVLDVGFAYGFLKHNAALSGLGPLDDYDSSLDRSVFQLGFSFMGKFPINLNGSADGPTVFPLLGGSYNLVMSMQDDKGKRIASVGNYSQLGLLGGAGLDYPIGETLFLRGEALFHFRFPGRKMLDRADLMSGVDAAFGLGTRVKLSVGARFE